MQTKDKSTTYCEHCSAIGYQYGAHIQCTAHSSKKISDFANQYEVRDYRVGDQGARFTATIENALALANERRTPSTYIMRVHDGAPYDFQSGNFGRRIYTDTGDILRLELAARWPTCV